MSGGGGTSGGVSFPAYLETVHNDWIDATGVDTIEKSMTEVMDTALGSSPFTALTAYDPTAEVAAIIAAPGGLETLVDLLSSDTGLDSLINSILDESRITDSVAAFSADLAAKADSDIYPRFEAGMRDINSVMSSAFVIGRALIADQLAREDAKFEGDLRYKAFGEDALRVIEMKLRYEDIVDRLKIESNRIKIVASKEETDGNIKLDEADATWDLETFQYGANVMAAVSGGTNPRQKSPSTAQSVIGGAVSGAATGAAVSGGNPLAMLAGGLLGAAASLI